MLGLRGSRLFIGLLVMFLVPVGAGFARSGGSHKKSDRAVSVTFGENMELGNGKTIPAGNYRMEIPADSQSPQVEFSQGGKVVATAEANVVSQVSKNPYTEVDSVIHGDSQVITAIRPAGWHEILRFTPANHAGSQSGGQ